MGLPDFQVASFQNQKALLFFSVIYPVSMTVIGCGLLVFMAELSTSLVLYIQSPVFRAVLVPCSQREAFMSLCLAIPAFLVMPSYANHLCNLPVGNPVSW